MKETVRLILVLTVTAALTGALLALANRLTEEPIQAARRAALLNSLERVLPDHDNEPDREQITLEIEGREHTFYPARRHGEFAGAALTGAAAGYGGVITVMIGIDAGDRIHAIHVLDHVETPGLGANITRPEFTGQFKELDGRNPERINLTRDQGAIDAVTAATVSSEAVIKAVREGVERYLAHRDTVREASRNGGRKPALDAGPDEPEALEPKGNQP